MHTYLSSFKICRIWSQILQHILIFLWLVMETSLDLHYETHLNYFKIKKLVFNSFVKKESLSNLIMLA